jgi:putative serine protease PepD
MRVVAATLLGMVLGGLIFAGGYYFAGVQPSAPQTGSQTGTRTVPVDIGDRDNQVEVAAADVVPSVVNVAVDAPTFSGVGSGIVIRSDGYILTNFHVVDGATSVTVRLGASDLPATVVGTDPTTDIAVIHIAKTGLQAAVIGSATSLSVGQTVIAVGSPFGLDKTVTSGIVSALHRTDIQAGSNGTLSSYTNLIQSDASINPGNSGGALADLTGAVVGMNTLIQSPSGGLGAAQSAGIGFAIPMDFAIPIADTLISGKKVTHPFLGVSSATVTPGAAQAFGLSSPSGALVQSVTPGSPAAAAGIRLGDIIVKFDGKTIGSSEEVFAAVQASKVGVAIPVVISRPSGDVTVNVTLVAQ